MKVFCNGFNLYGQLGISLHLIEKFTSIFGGYSLEELYISHTFSVLKVDGIYKILSKNKEKIIDNCGRIIKMCSNDERVVFFNDDGKLFKIDLTDTSMVFELPNMLNSEFPDERIVNVICGSKLSIAYSDKGNLYNIPHKLNFKNGNIIDIQCGKEHCILLDKFGNVYTFGRGSRGQLGHGQLEDETEPIQIEALGGLKITQIAAGGWHSCALSCDGDLYTWGWNGNGQLGLGVQENEESSVSVMASPHVADFPDPERNALKVACGSRHTIVLLDNNQLVGCGWNKYKQLISVNSENFNNFTYLQDFSQQEVAALKCGPWNSAVLCK